MTPIQGAAWNALTDYWQYSCEINTRSSYAAPIQLHKLGLIEQMKVNNLYLYRLPPSDLRVDKGNDKTRKEY